MYDVVRRAQSHFTERLPNISMQRSLLKLLTFPREKCTGGCWLWGRNRQERKMWRGLHFHVYTSTCAVYLQPPASPFWSALSLVLGKMGLKKSPVCWGCRRRHSKRSQYRFLKNFHVTAVKLTSVFDPYQTLGRLFKTFLGPPQLSCPPSLSALCRHLVAPFSELRYHSIHSLVPENS